MNTIHALTALLAALCACTAQAVEPVRVQFVAGDARAIGADGSERSLRKGDVLAPGERLVTGDNGLVQLRSEGQGVVALRANSDVKLPPGSEGLSLDVLSGQVRTVALPGDGASPPVRLGTPTGMVEMSQGDLVSSVPADGPDTSGESFVRVHAGEARVQGGNEAPMSLEPGKAIALGEGSLRSLPPAEIPVTVLPAAQVARLPGEQTLPVPAPTPMPEKALAAVDARLPPAALPALPVVAVAGAVPRPGAATLPGPTDPALPAVPRDLGKLPDIRPVVTTLQVDGGSLEVNRALGQLPVVAVGRAVGPQSVQILPEGSLTPRAPSNTTLLQATVSMIDNQALPTLSPRTTTSLVNNGVVATGLVLTRSTLNMGAIPTAVQNQGNTTLNTLNAATVVNPTGSGSLNTPILNFNTFRRF